MYNFCLHKCGIFIQCDCLVSLCADWTCIFLAGSFRDETRAPCKWLISAALSKIKLISCKHLWKLTHEQTPHLLHLQKTKIHKNKTCGLWICIKISASTNTLHPTPLKKKPYKNIALGLQNMHQKFNIHTHLTCTFKNQNSQKLNTLVLKYA